MLVAEHSVLEFFFCGLTFLFFANAIAFCYYCGQAYDQHLNMVLGNVEETIKQSTVDPQTNELVVQVRCRGR